MPTVRIYQRVSTSKQKTDSQEGDLKRWAEYKAKEGFAVVWYTDKFSGKSLNRPAFAKLQKELQAGDTVAVWRLDRLGRTTVGLVNLFDGWSKAGIGFYSLRDSFDLNTASGRLVLNMLISIAAYETELRSERVEAAKATRKARGETTKKPGPPKGQRLTVTAEAEALVRKLAAESTPVARIARTVHLSRPTVYSILKTV